MSLIHSHLNWGATIFGAAKPHLLNKLSSAQNKAIRNLTKTKYNAHSILLYKKLEILKVTDLITLNRCIEVCKFRKNLLPSSLEKYFKYQAETGDRRLSENELNLSIPITTGQGTELFPIPELIREWNRIPVHIKKLDKLSHFKSQLKSYLLEKYILDCTTPNCYSGAQSNFDPE